MMHQPKKLKLRKKDGDLLVIVRKKLINLLGHITKFLPMKKSQGTNHSLDSSQAAMDMDILYFFLKIGSPLFPSPTLAALLQQDWLQLNPL